MSVDAQNVKIITQDGKVTLRGPVHTAAEKATIEQIANDVAGEARLTVNSRSPRTDILHSADIALQKLFEQRFTEINHVKICLLHSNSGPD